MKKTLWSRLIICFLISTVTVFVLLNTYGMSILKNRIKKDQINLLYKEASLIANAYRGNIFDENNELNDWLPGLHPLIPLKYSCLNVSRDGSIVADSSNVNNPQM